jgi:hypothetical protein
MIRRISGIGLTLYSALLAVSGCGHQSGSPAGQDIIMNGLLAQVTGMGGCFNINKLETHKISFFPSLTFDEGSCLLEHGDTANALIARDDAGQVYLLDNKSSFDFLLRMHKPPLVERDSAVTYVVFALRMMGEINQRDTLVKVSSALTDSVLVEHGVARRELRESSRLLQSGSRSYQVAIMTMGPGGISDCVAILYPDSGIVRLVSKNNWRIAER